MITKPSPAPWRAVTEAPHRKNPAGTAMVATDVRESMCIDCTRSGASWMEDIANAERIVQCVNSHDALLAAVQWSEQFHLRPGEGYSECFDRIAEVFYRETGYMRPGKDASPQAGQSIEERQAAWDEWLAAGIARARAALSLAGQQGQKT